MFYTSPSPPSSPMKSGGGGVLPRLWGKKGSDAALALESFLSGTAAIAAPGRTPAARSSGGNNSGIPRLLQSGLSTLGSLLILVLVLALVGYQAEIHETVIRQTRGDPKTSDWPIVCPVPLTIDMPNQTRLMSSPQAFQLRIKLLAYNRLPSLSRCLQSLVAAHYDGDVVRLAVMVDHMVEAGGEEQNMTATDEALATSHEILAFLSSFQWPHGPKDIHYRSSNVGLQAQWVEAWWPASDHEFALVLEDDVEVSPFFYRFLRTAVNTYYFDPANFDPSIFGVTLERARVVAGKRGNPISMESNTTQSFLYQMIGPVGQLLFPKQWKEFRLWYDVKKAHGIKPLVEGLLTTHWYRKYGEKIWTPWFVRFLHSREYRNLFLHLPDDHALAVTHRDAGGRYRESLGPDAELLREGDVEGQGEMWSMTPLKKLPRFNLCFQEVPINRMARSPDEIEAFLSSIATNQTVILVNAMDAPLPFLRNWLCHASKAGLSNYAVLTDNNLVGLDLARRGHPVLQLHLIQEAVEAEAEATVLEGRGHKQKKTKEASSSGVASSSSSSSSSSSGSSGGMGSGSGSAAVSGVSGGESGGEEGARKERPEWSREKMWLDALHSTLHLGFDVIATRPDTVWLGDVMSLLGTPEADVVGRLDEGQLDLGLLFLKSSKGTEKMWQHVMNMRKKMSLKVSSIEMEREEQMEDTGGVEVPRMGAVIWESCNAMKVIVSELRGSAVKSLNDYVEHWDEKGTSDTSLVSFSSSFLTEDAESIIHKMEDVGLWSIDEDLACLEVVCTREQT